MTRSSRKYLLMSVLAAAAWLSGDLDSGLVTSAHAIIGRPATPVSYAGVARRSTVGFGAPGVGAAPMNRGGPVNRVGVR